MNTEQILANAENISLATDKDQSELCKIWPTVKQGLLLLADIIKNPFVKFTISGIVAAGDAIIGKICG